MWRYPLLLSSALRAQRGRRLFLGNLLTPVVMRGIAYRQFCTQRGSNIQTWLISQVVIDGLLNPTFVKDPTHRGKVSGLLDLVNRRWLDCRTGLPASWTLMRRWTRSTQALTNARCWWLVRLNNFGVAIKNA